MRRRFNVSNVMALVHCDGLPTLLTPRNLFANSYLNRIENLCVDGSIPSRATKNYDSPPSGGFFIGSLSTLT
jgi:hypothetical protein